MHTEGYSQRSEKVCFFPLAKRNELSGKCFPHTLLEVRGLVCGGCKSHGFEQNSACFYQTAIA